MAEVINLRLARKARARRTATERAAENRARHGRTRTERALETAEVERAARLLEGHKLAGNERDDID